MASFLLRVDGCFLILTSFCTRRCRVIAFCAVAFSKPHFHICASDCCVVFSCVGRAIAGPAWRRAVAVLEQGTGRDQDLSPLTFLSLMAATIVEHINLPFRLR